MAEYLNRMHSDLVGRKQLLVDEIAQAYFPNRPQTIVPLAISLAVITQSAEQTTLSRRKSWRRFGLGGIYW